MSLTRRIVAVLVGLILALFGLLFFTLMCGNNAHLFGALLGALAGVLLGWRRRARRLLWWATAGSIVLALLGTLMEYLSTGGCAGIVNALGAGVCIGIGVGLAIDGLRPATGPEAPRPGGDAGGPAGPADEGHI